MTNPLEKQFPELFCQDCLLDPEIKCKRDKDVKCLCCGAELCAYHMNKHLEEKHQVSITWKGIGVPEASVRSVTAVTVWIVDYDLPANNSRRQFYRRIQKYLLEHSIDAGTAWSTQSVVITDDEEFAEFVFAEASQVGRCHMYKAERIR